ncbi:MAG TPA: hypothetical protein PKN29_11870 [Candidatus Ozemobacteraceae bacterium]|nr:hypothetical protein [Candidatus Ozemobacteraceae bacterium]
MAKLRKSLFSLLFALLLIVSLLSAPIQAAPEESSTGRLRISFSAAVEKSLKGTATALDRATLALFEKLDKTDNLSVKVRSHFYDTAIRRYFVSISGEGIFQGKLPFKLKHDSYLVSSNQEISYDFYFSEVREDREGIRFKYSGNFVVSLDRVAYRMIQTIPHLAASGSLGPVFDMLSDFFDKLNIGILSEAISETLRKFSTVALTKAGTELISQAGKNKNLGKVIAECIKDGSMLSFIGITIIKTASISAVSVSGASLGAAVGSLVAPGPGTAVGAFLGSQIMTLAAKMLVHELTAELPLKINIKRLTNSWHILQHNPGDEEARQTCEEVQKKIEKKIAAEFNREKFSLFETLIEQIEKMPAEDRPAMISVLKRLQQLLGFKITNEGDWYYARQYYQLKAAVEKWGLQKHVVFTVEPRQNSAR